MPGLRRQVAVQGLWYPEGRRGAGKALPGGAGAAHGSDSTATKDAHEKLLAKFAAHEYDIMVGTQMVAKGLDFEDVTLVGAAGH